jgi:hypothetical protein
LTWSSPTTSRRRSGWRRRSGRGRRRKETTPCWSRASCPRATRRSRGSCIPSVTASTAGGRWSELATPRGVTIGPETSFREASGLSSRDDDELWQRYQPSDGSLPAAETAALGAALAPHTGTPDECLFCGSRVWVSDNGETYYGHLSDEENEALNAPIRARWERELTALESLPRVELPNREHYLFTGPLGRTARPFTFGMWEQSPSMWWPADRAWFVGTEVDGFSSDVGGSGAAIAAVLASPELEALAVTARTPMDPGPFG